MHIDNENRQEETDHNGAAAGQRVREATEPRRSEIAKLLVWPHSEPALSEALAGETAGHPNQPKSDKRNVEYVQAISQWTRSSFKRRLIRALLLVAVLASVATIGYLAISLRGDYGLKGVLNRLLSFVAPDGDGASTGQVTGIIYSDDKSSAVIGNSLVHEGDMLYDVRIIKIHHERVEFERDGQIWSQRLREHPAKYWPKPLENNTQKQ
ncbi:MAG: hypothetical protein JXN61_00295 [Sedimentisphaerales bacterium]|nr:hypothetical protein [Sedimentisphaerales bacterium]